jgi:hypothetical protein
LFSVVLQREGTGTTEAAEPLLARLQELSFGVRHTSIDRQNTLLACDDGVTGGNYQGLVEKLK